MPAVGKGLSQYFMCSVCIKLADKDSVLLVKNSGKLYRPCMCWI